MKIFGDYHTHTIYSRRHHGKGTIRENVEAAIQKGLSELIISDHGPGHILFGIDKKKLPEMRECIDKLNAEFAGKLKIYLGMEANVLTYDGKIDLSPNEMQYLDKISVGFHYGCIPRDLSSFIKFMILNPLSKILTFMESWMIEQNTKALMKIVENYPVDILTHPGSKAKIDVRQLARFCRDRGTALEVNAYHGKLTVEEIRICAEEGCKLSVGSDAHSPQRVGDIHASLERIKKAGIPISLIINAKE